MLTNSSKYKPMTQNVDLEIVLNERLWFGIVSLNSFPNLQRWKSSNVFCWLFFKFYQSVVQAEGFILVKIPKHRQEFIFISQLLKLQNSFKFQILCLVTLKSVYSVCVLQMENNFKITSEFKSFYSVKKIVSSCC